MNRICEFRKIAGLSQLAAAQAAGWAYQSRWSQYERGVRAVDIDTGRVIVRVLNDHGVACSLDDVFPPAHAVQAA